MPLVLRAQALWNALIQQSGEELFQSCGVLNLGPQHSEFIRNAQQSAQKFRLNAQTLSAEQIAQRWPEFRAPEGYVGVFEPDAGFLRSELAVASLIKLAKEAGCSQLFNCPVSAVEPIDGGVEVVTGEGRFTAQKPWSPPAPGESAVAAAADYAIAQGILPASGGRPLQREQSLPGLYRRSAGRHALLRLPGG